MLNLHLERLSDIALADEDVSFEDTRSGGTQMLGRIELRGVSFRYATNDPLVLQDVNLVVEAGEYIAITGPSGGGKSTLAKILLGLVEPTEGVVLIDSVPLRQFGYKAFHNQVGAVLQDDALFKGSIADNIALFEDEPLSDVIDFAAKNAAIYDDIMAMPMQYDTFIGDMGSALSGGQKQRLLLARALYRRPRLLVLDEGTAHLDVENERAVNRAIGEIGVTRIIIAHREETVSSANRVFVMNDGRLTETDWSTRRATNAHV